MKTRKILLSAYACEPGKGSEPGVGWHWALELARLGHDVWVLTRANNRPVIEAALAGRPPGSCPHFLYYDLPAWARWWKKGRRGLRLYYFLWQWGAYGIARKFHERERFDLVHHITFGVVRLPSFMGNLGIPFVFGPVGGGEKAPWRLRIGYPLRGWVLDAARDLANLAVRFDPLMRRTFRQATYIYVKTPETGRLIPAKFRAKVRCTLEIGIDLLESGQLAGIEATEQSSFRVLYVGNFLYLKGMHLGLRAFAKFSGSHPGARLTIVGDGPDGQSWKRLADRLQVSEKTDWIPWLGRDQLLTVYRQHDLLMFPTLHDSSGNVVLEAMAHGLPVVCLDLGGPGEMVDNTCGRIVSTAGKTSDAVVSGLAEALAALADDPAVMTRLSQGARSRACQSDWRTIVNRVYSEIENG